MNRSFSKIRHIQESNIKLEKRILNEEFDDFDFRGFLKDGETLSRDKMPDLINAMQSTLDRFYEKHKEVIDRHYYLKNKDEQHEFAKNPKFSLSVINKSTNPQILAKVKWPFEYNGNNNKNGYITMHVGGKKQFPEWLNTPNVEEISREIISNKLLSNTSFPND
jgi:hypothetical protein